MKLKLLIVITILVVIGVAIIAVVKKSNTMPKKPEITEITTDVQVEMKPTIMKESMGTQTQPTMDGGNDEKIETIEEFNKRELARQKTKLNSLLDSIERIVPSAGVHPPGERPARLR